MNTKTKVGRLATDINDGFKERLGDAMREEFDGLEIETYYDLFGSMAHVSRRVDGSDFTPEQMAFLKGWSEGYGIALTLVRQAEGR